MTESPEELAAVEQLLAERDALHGWLLRLDQASVAAPEAVRRRVRDDYQQRLDQLTAGLRAHSDLIASKLDDDRREHDHLTSRARTAREALAEAELRHAVGEYDRNRYDAERVHYSSDIETYELSLAAVAERIARLEEVHNLVERAPRTAAAEPEPELESPELEVHVISEVEEELVAIADLSPDADPEDVLAIFEVDAAAEAAGQAGVPSPADTVGPLSFRPAGVRPAEAEERPATPSTSRPRPAEVAPPLGIPHAHEPPRFVRPGERMRQASGATSPPAPPAATRPSGGAPDADDELFAEDIVATGPAEDHATPPVSRTLRCGECGAMNRPLEWYCEKCGAELTAV